MNTPSSLNGAQTQALIGIIGQYAAGTITEGQAVNLIATSIGVSKEEARRILTGDLNDLVASDAPIEA